ncbi:MAG TPA: hypothetical protein VKE95_07385 [Burkholderiales bacterium]|nr:hypothetical protein [Burkholderiales bacterium]
MGDLATNEALLSRWDEVLRDPSLQDLPCKIELNAWGKVEMRPASNRHGHLQALIAAELLRQLPGGTAIGECSILTRIGIRVPDVVWASTEFMAAFGEITPFMRSPAAGAKEVWIVAEAGSVRYFDSGGEKGITDSPVLLKLPPPMVGKP